MLRSTLHSLTLAAGLLPAAGLQAAADLDGLVDPTAPINVTVSLAEQAAAIQLLPQLESYKLNSVLIRNGDRIAVVNGQRARIGDMVGAARVTRIDQNGVLLVVNGEVQTLALYGEPVKTPVAGGE